MSSHRTCVLVREPVPNGVAYALHLATFPEGDLSHPILRYGTMVQKSTNHLTRR